MVALSPQRNIPGAYKALHGLVCGTSVASPLTQITLLTFSSFTRQLDSP